jgi:hypothetical protein
MIQVYQLKEGMRMMKAFRFAHRTTGKTIIFRSNSFAQAVSDLYATLDRTKADEYKFKEML